MANTQRKVFVDAAGETHVSLFGDVLFSDRVTRNLYAGDRGFDGAFMRATRTYGTCAVAHLAHLYY